MCTFRIDWSGVKSALAGLEKMFIYREVPKCDCFMQRAIIVSTEYLNKNSVNSVDLKKKKPKERKKQTNKNKTKQKQPV